ncbi:phosphate ABC transporter permease PstA [Streptomyces sp. DSM 41982]|uniref:Phosphate transport system permease protein PstA n=1 Tax=Streptomyces evansiae TaxID=3075535 RepID=A0ABD5EEU3_9ACTN|nr:MULTISPECIES: phosphate ABC transporter permease PstA [unclassified Streptomyces]MDT0419576.1 phosphate ABC transporter permease PstA [Streptomyces sp. DSM 41982]SCE21407.1 phosphate transport system permease protein [Streptomyces sp. SolWspMP-sol7th]
MSHDQNPAGGQSAPQHTGTHGRSERTGSLRAARLPRWSDLAVAAASVLLACLVGVAAGLDSKVQWGLIAALLFVFGGYALAARVEGRRQAKDRLVTSVVWVAFLAAFIPLASLVWETVKRGVKVLDPYFLTHSMVNISSMDEGGGIYHAIVGSVEQVGLATVMAAPVGLLTAVYLVEYGRGKLAKTVTFFVDVMTGIPSIVAGLFILSLMLLLKAEPFGFAGSLALAILMIPVVVRSTEEMLKLVPNELREASLALGVPKWRTILKVVLPTSIGGITTGVMLAIARIAGETAPVLLLVWGSSYINMDPFHGGQSSLPLYIYQQYATSGGYGASYDRAWAAALTLIAFVMVLNLAARALARWKAPQSSGR